MTCEQFLTLNGDCCEVLYSKFAYVHLTAGRECVAGQLLITEKDLP